MNVKQLNFHIKVMNPKVAILVKGVHGIGKTQIITKAICDLGMECIVFVCSQIGDVGDFIGLPKHQEYINRFYKIIIGENGEPDVEVEMTAEEYMKTEKSEKYRLVTKMYPLTSDNKNDIGKGEITTLTKFCPPYWYRKGVDIGLFLDEINRPRQEIANAVMQLTLEKRILDLELTKNSRIFGAINPASNARYGVDDMGAAQLDRWQVVEFRPDVEEFLQEGERRGYHESVLNYVEANPKNLIPYDNEEATSMATKGSEQKVPSPRSYEMLSDTIFSYENFDKRFFFHEGNDKLLAELVKGCVGPYVATEFTECYFSKSINPKDALEDPDSSIETLKGYHAGRQKRFMNSLNKYLQEHVENMNLQFEIGTVLTTEPSIAKEVKKIQLGYRKLIDACLFEVKASIYNKTFVASISKSEAWVRMVVAEKLKLNGEDESLTDGRIIKKEYRQNAIDEA